jgi:MerR family transcriptional regulator/heat shock protein HspR
MPASTNPETPLYPIGTAARLLGISVHTMRMYERRGLIVPHKSGTSHRLYSANDIDRLRCIRSAINVEKISIEGMRRILSLIPCWTIVHCGEADRQVCPAYTGHSGPCWSLKQKGAFCSVRACRSCEVYRNYGDCKSIKERLRSLLPE